MSKVLVICGATATGKTALAVNCARVLSGEVISADSQLVYSGLNIGTAKPTYEEMGGIRHHMIDVVDPKESFSVSDYREKALPILEDIISRGKTPIICGGTGFYINSLLFNFSYGNAAADEEIRKKYQIIAERDGACAVYNILKDVDPQTAEKLHENDLKRIIRALEIYEVTGRRKSEQNDKLIPKFEYKAFAIDYPREELYSRIDRRVDEMFANGLVEEVQSLINGGIGENYQCMQAIGYKEVVSGLNSNYLHSTMSDIIKQNTRHYAKRQITFFKKLPNIVWLKPNKATAENIVEIINEK